MAHNENLSIGVFIDGGYFAKIDEGLARKNMGKVNVKGLFQFIPDMISKQFGIDRKLLYIRLLSSKGCCSINKSHPVAEKLMKLRQLHIHPPHKTKTP